MKKWFAFILLFIIAFTAITPCCIASNCPDMQTLAQHNSSEKETGICSPFFSCTNCPGFIEVAKIITVPAISIFKMQYYSKKYPFTLSKFAASPWQPPRLNKMF